MLIIGSCAAAGWRVSGGLDSLTSLLVYAAGIFVNGGFSLEAAAAARAQTGLRMGEKSQEIPSQPVKENLSMSAWQDGSITVSYCGCLRSRPRDLTASVWPQFQG